MSRVFTFVATVWPSLPAAGKAQVVMGNHDPSRQTGYAFGLDERGHLLVIAPGLGKRETLSDRPLQARHWYRIWLSMDLDLGQMELGYFPISKIFGDAGQVTSLAIDQGGRYFGDNAMCFAAGFHDGEATHFFNGKIERPRVFDRALTVTDMEALGSSGLTFEPLADWDFSQNISSMDIGDRGPFQLHGHLLNGPGRAMTGSNWTGEEMCWQKAPEQYGAIHFHDDDIYDAGWESDFSFVVPNDLGSAVYGMKLTCERASDVIPFYVTPDQETTQNRIAVVIPTYTYMAYGNHARVSNDEEYMAKAKAWGARSFTPDQCPQFGLSTYNLHRDGSGTSYASRLRPLLNLRPNYLTFSEGHAHSGVHHFGADFYLLSWLDQLGLGFDLLTDEELEENSDWRLARYSVVMTTSHPEYHTKNSLEAISEFLENGGRLMYLGGNGFYWRVSVHPALPGLLEVRRNENGIRSWISEPGEYYHSLDGTYGGLWRNNGRPPQKLVGVGFTAQGKFQASGYRRSESSYAHEVSWIFEGIETVTFGERGFAGGGAAGYELDRADTHLGTPSNAVVIATSEAPGRSFRLVNEELLWSDETVSGEPISDLIRCDMVFFETPAGGMVFSAGSITFTGCLPINNNQNDVSKLTENVLKRFLNEKNRETERRSAAEKRLTEASV